MTINSASTAIIHSSKADEAERKMLSVPSNKQIIHKNNTLKIPETLLKNDSWLPKPVSARVIPLNSKQIKIYRKLRRRRIQSLFWSKIVYLSSKLGSLLKHPGGFFGQNNSHLESVASTSSLDPNLSQDPLKVTIDIPEVSWNSNISILQTKDFLDFVNKREQDLFNDLQEDFLNADSELRFYLCPLSKKLPKKPMTVYSSDINPQKFHYDYEYVSKLLDDGKIPVGLKKQCVLADFVLDIPCITSIIGRLENLTQTLASVTHPLNDKIKKLMSFSLKMSQSLQKERVEEIKKLLDDLENKHQKGEISYSELFSNCVKIQSEQIKVKKQPIVSEPFFLWKWFGAQSTLERFEVNVTAIHEPKYLGADRESLIRVSEEDLKEMSQNLTKKIVS